MHVFANPTNSFTYVLPSTCHPKKNINNVTKGIALRLRRIYTTDETFDICSSEYQNYFIARVYKPTLIKDSFMLLNPLADVKLDRLSQK